MSFSHVVLMLSARKDKVQKTIFDMQASRSRNSKEVAKYDLSSEAS